MTEKSYNYETKRKLRSILRKIIKQNIPDEDIKKNKVLFFPAEECLEVFEVYDKLGIPRKNLFGIERDEKVYDKIKRKNLGINLFNSTDLEFLNKTSDKFGIINLDYQGEFNESKLESICLISKKQLLENKSVLGTNFFCRREGKEVKNRYATSMIIEKFGEWEKWYKRMEDNSPKEDLENLLDNGEDEKAHQIMKEMLDKRDTINFTNSMGMDLKEIKNRGITIEILRLLKDGKNSKYISKDFEKLISDGGEFMPSFMKLNPEFEMIEKRRHEDSAENILRVLKESKERIKYKILKFPKIREKLEESLGYIEKIEKEFLAETNNKPIFGRKNFDEQANSILKQTGKENQLVLSLKYSLELGGAFPTMIKRFKYNSDDGSPMYVDYFVLDKFKETIEDLASYFEIVVENNQMKVKRVKGANSTEEVKNWQKKLYTLGKHSDINSIISMIGPRVYLGSSYKPKYDAEETAKMILEGKTEEDIKQKFRISKMELAGMKASITKGYYDSTKKSMEEEKSKNLEKVVIENKTEQNKDVSIYLDVMSGLPDRIIMDRYNLETMPLAGYKAAIKRGDRKEIVEETSKKISNLEKNIVVNNTLSRISYDGIYYLKNGWDTPREIFNLYKENNIQIHEIEQLEGKESVLILQNKDNPNKTLKTVEDFCLNNKNFSPAVIIIDYESNGIKDKLQESVRAQKELGFISRVFYYDQKNQSKFMKDILENSYLVR